MTGSTLRFESQKDILEVATVLMRLHNIQQGRDLVWLLNDGDAADNLDVVSRWLRAEVWRRKIDCEDIDLKALSNALNNRLVGALRDIE